MSSQRETSSVASSAAADDAYSWPRMLMHSRYASIFPSPMMLRSSS